jgi:DNA-binding winged helix-turn-helix (wHTH) protein/tetratricopeptide (TPR) repeat protein
MPSTLYRFRDFKLDPATRELRRQGEVIALPASAFDCLLYLIEHRNRAIGRDELIAAIWGRSDATDALLAQTLVRVRRALGDTGNEQHTVQTVPRFGYRWVAEVIEGGEIAAAQPLVELPADVSSPADTSSVSPAVAPRRSWIRLAVIVTLCALLAVLAVRGYRALHSRAGPATTAPPSADTVMPAAVVLPAEVAGGEEWAWLRLGLMDLVSNRLRRGDLSTVASENVVSLLGDAATTGTNRLDDPRLTGIAGLRVLPYARLEGDVWKVRLQTAGGQRPLSVEASARDILGAGREASDLLLAALGHAPPAGGSGPAALDELLQRTRAAMLANQFDMAKRLIEQAPAELRTHPELVLRWANIELRAGDYLSAKARLQVLIDGASSSANANLRGRALITLAAIHIRRGEATEAEAAYAEAIDLLEGQNDPGSLGIAYHGRGLVALLRGDVDAALPDLGHARTELARAGSALGIAQIDINLALTQNMRHRPADALTLLRSIEQRVGRIGAQEELIYTRVSIAETELELLDNEAALATTEQYWPPAAHGANVRTLWKLMLVRARALAAVGRIAEAQALVEQIRRGADPAQDEPAIAHNAILATQLALLHGDIAQALADSEAALAPVLRNGEDMSWYVRAKVLRLRVLRAAGNMQGATGQLAGFGQLARGGNDVWVLAMFELATAEQQWATGRHDEALRSYASALRRCERNGTPTDMVEVAAPYVLALIDSKRLDEAKAVNGRIAAWSEHDLRAATAQARLFEALGESDAIREAEAVVARLSERDGAVVR